MSPFHPAQVAILLSVLFFLCVEVAHLVTGLPRAIKLKSCNCGAHWWIKRWGFWRHLDASPFNDLLQNRWTMWMFEFREYLVLSVAEQKAMGYANGPIWEDGRPMWKRSKTQWSPQPASYCARCALHGQ